MNHTKLRVTRREAMTLLGIKSQETFRKVVDANPQVCHRLPGEVRHKYIVAELTKMLRSVVPGEGQKHL